jgi:hypothetical protein
VTVDVFYEGYALGKGLAARAEGERVFVEMAQPMPVATWLTYPETGSSGTTPASWRVVPY